ncbi:MAG: DUF2344 domain-containing protein [Clostridia bacterium]|nr:DUF2344 domain-containing protein [Clostridia bacterium]
MVQPMPIRAKFYKVGSLQFISHLDLVRTMTRNLTRAGIPAWYSQGFNPRLKLTFSLPLSIGTQSECEFFDIRLVEPMELDEVKRRINETLTDEMKIVDVYQSERKFSDIAWAEYEIRMTSPKFSSETADALRELYTNPLTLVKRSKSGEKEVDILPYIDLRDCKFDGESIVINAFLSADSADYLNPEYLIKGAEQKLGITFDDPFTEFYTIMRREVYLADKVIVFR